jgi:hypothetical protein
MPRGRTLRVGGWYVKKPFAHFDLPLNFDAALSKVSDTQLVIERSFWPLIGFVDSKRKFKKEAGLPPNDLCGTSNRALGKKVELRKAIFTRDL